MIDHILLKVKVTGDVDEYTLLKIIEGIYGVHLDVYSVESEAVEHNAHLTPETQATSQAVVNASALEPSDGESSPAQAQVA